mgnify:CR=1 FL=1
MSKIRTSIDLQTRLDEDFVWRIREISEMKISVRTAKANRDKTLVRAGIALLYAHWEGFIKNASQYYLEFVASQRLPYKDLKNCFIVFGLKKELDMIISSKQHAKNVRVIEFLKDELLNRAELSFKGAIDTESNLSSTVFANIAESVGVDTTPYQTKYNFIDESLLSRRNQIAHGEFLDISPEEYPDLSNEVVNLLRAYKTDIENCLVLKTYMAT